MVAIVDPYLVLGLNYADQPSDLQIRQAYRRKALIYHPDRNSAQDSHLKFQEAKQASIILLDPELRRAFDAIYEARKESQRRLQEASADR